MVEVSLIGGGEPGEKKRLEIQMKE